MKVASPFFFHRSLFWENLCQGLCPRELIDRQSDFTRRRVILVIQLIREDSC